MIIIFDTETTGLFPGQICQLSYIMIDEKERRTKNFYFTVEHMEDSATAVNHLTVESLYSLSKGRLFSVDAEEIYNDFSAADLLIGHNVIFDISFLTREFEREKFSFRVKEKFCTMRYFTNILKLPTGRVDRRFKFPKLTELTAFYRLTEDKIADKTEELFGVSGGAHDARYDTAAVYMAVECAVNEGDMYLNDLLSRCIKGGVYYMGSEQ